MDIFDKLADSFQGTLRPEILYEMREFLKDETNIKKFIDRMKRNIEDDIRFHERLEKLNEMSKLVHRCLRRCP